VITGEDAESVGHASESPTAIHGCIDEPTIALLTVGAAVAAQEGWKEIFVLERSPRNDASTQVALQEEAGPVVQTSKELP